MLRRIRELLKQSIKNIGLLRAVRFLVIFVLEKLGLTWHSRNSTYQLAAKYALYPLQARCGTSDIDVFRQIFVEREYACLDNVSEPDLIVDCGANVGYSSAYFLSTFPQCSVIAIEPDPSNVTVLEANLAPYGDRVTVIRAGVWSHSTGIKIVSLGEDRGWETQVRECAPGEIADVRATDIGTVLRESGKKHISILKMDIEGSEAIVFASNYSEWLNAVDNIVIELHDYPGFKNASEIFHKAIGPRDFDISQSGELTVCKSRG